jgi:hypothetical protein
MMTMVEVAVVVVVVGVALVCSFRWAVGLF